MLTFFASAHHQYPNSQGVGYWFILQLIVMTNILANPILILIITQLLFTSTDLLGRYEMTRSDHFFSNMLKPWFVVYVMIRLVASLGQLFVFSRIELGKTMALFGMASIVLSNFLGLLLLNESLSVYSYLGIVVAIAAFLILALA